MSAGEIAAVVEGWSTLAGLMVVVAGAVFAGVQLRQKAKARRFQALTTVLADIRPPEVSRAWQVVRALPDGFDPAEISQAARDARILVVGSYVRLGTLLAMDVVSEREIFLDLSQSRGCIEAWEKLKHVVRAEEADVNPVVAPQLRQGVHFENLAARAQAWLLHNGEDQFGSVPHFDADLDALAAMGQRVAEARATAN